MRDGQDQSMELVDHLGELRKRIILTGVSFFIFLILGFVFVQEIYAFFVKDVPFKLTVLSPTEVIWVYFTLSSIVAIICTIPVLASQVWLFVRPGLTPKERKVTLAYIPSLFFLFIGGLAFGYYIIMPFLFNFLLELSADLFETMFTTEKYFQFIIKMTLPFGVLFELPLLIMFLTSLGIVDPFKLIKIRKYSYFVLVIISTVITPPDFLSAIIVMIPLFLLYEFSIFLSRIVYNKKLKEQEESIS